MKTRDDDDKNFSQHMGLIPYSKFMTELMNDIKDRVVKQGGHNRDLNEVLYDLFCHHTGRSIESEKELESFLAKFPSQVCYRIRKAYTAQQFMQGNLGIDEVALDGNTLAGLEKINDQLKELMNMLGISEDEISVVHVDADGKVIAEGVAGTPPESPVEEPIDPELEERIRGAAGFKLPEVGEGKN